MEQKFGWDTRDEFPSEETEYPSCSILKTLYVYRISENECLTHDGYIQIGIMNHSVEKHIELCPLINWIETYWYPDVFTDRYKRATFQKTAKANEGSPATDNQGKGIDIVVKSKGCNKLQNK